MEADLVLRSDWLRAARDLIRLLESAVMSSALGSVLPVSCCGWLVGGTGPKGCC